MSNETHQVKDSPWRAIARESSEKCAAEAYGLYRKSGIDSKSKFEPIILAAIEKGIQAWRDGGYDSDKEPAAGVRSGCQRLRTRL